MPKPKSPPLVDPNLILDPTVRFAFGRRGSDAITVYHLLLVHIYNIIYSKEIREKTATSYEKDKKKRPLPGKKKVRLAEWRRSFHAAMWDKVKNSRMFGLGDVPKKGEKPTSTVIRPTKEALTELERIKQQQEVRYTRRVTALLEENMAELLADYQKEEDGRV